MSIELYELIGLSPQLEIKNFKVFLKGINWLGWNWNSLMKILLKKTDKWGIALCRSKKYFLIEDILIFEKLSFEKIRSET